MILERPDARIAFDDTGCGSPVLFIHGHPFNRSMWFPQVAALRDSHRLITADLRGYGDSTVNAKTCDKITLETFAEDHIAVLDHLGVDKAMILGLSMGGQIAMEIARAFPERILGLGLVATFPQPETPAGVALRNETADRLLAEGMAAHGAETLPKLIGKTSMTRYPHLAANVYRMICSTNPAAAAAALRGRAMRRDYEPVLKAVSVPTLIVGGTEDFYTSVDVVASMHRSIAGSRLELFDGIGHMPNLEAPDRFNAVLADFLASAL